MISVIIPVYNVAPYLPECLDSVIGQTYTDLEIIIVNDGSTDESGAICNSYAQKDHRIRVIHQQNQGLSAARNAGIDAAHGEYISFLDSDDYMMPDLLEHLLNLCLEYGADMSACSFDILLESGKRIPRKGISFASMPEVYTGYEKMHAYVSLNKISTTAYCKLYDRTLFREIRFPVGRLHEDVFTTCQLVHAAKKIVISGKIGCIYRMRADSITHAPYSPQYRDIVLCRLEQLQFIQEHYPSLIPDMHLKVVDSAVHLTIKPGIRQSCETETLHLLQSIFRKYCREYILNAHSVKRKIYVILASIHVPAAFLLSDYIRAYRRLWPR